MDKKPRGHNFKTGYACPLCIATGDYSPKPALYRRITNSKGSQVFTFSGFVECPAHGVQAGIARNQRREARELEEVAR